MAIITQQAQWLGKGLDEQGLVRLWKLATHTEGGTYAKGFQEQGAEDQ